jgi:hypothetical protein
MRRYSSLAIAAAMTAFAVTAFYAQSPTALTGMRDPAFSPDGKRIAVSWLEAVWTMTPDGRDEKPVVTARGQWVSERDPAWSPDGKSIAFAADSAGAYDLYVAPASGGTARKVTSLDGDERWPSWTRDGRLVFSHRPAGGRWQLHAVASDGTGAPAKLTRDAASEWQAQVSPDGRRLVFISDRDLEPGDDADVFVRELADESPREVRVTRGGGTERFPAWAPDNTRVSYMASRQGLGTGTFVSELPAQSPEAPSAGGAAGGPSENATQPSRAGGPGGPAGRGGGANTTMPLVLASRKAGVSAWSPDGQTLLIATVSTTASGYNGNPARNDDEAPAAFAEAGTAQLWHVAAPRRVDDQSRSIGAPEPASGRWVGQFDRAWQTLKSLYYSNGDSAVAWDALRAKHRPAAIAAKSARDVENVVDAMVAEQPLIKPVVEKTTGVVTSGHPLASAAGAHILEIGGNIVDAIVATSFALGVVEPDASGVGGDGQAVLFMKGMSEPVVIEYKDMTPARATFDNLKIFTPTGQRTASDGPTVVNIPGVVAGLDLLFQKYGSKKVTWEQVLAPAIALAEKGYILDESLPTTIAAGRAGFAKYPEAAKIYLPNGQVPKPGDRFINKDYAETLKVLAKEGGQSFYRGSIARKIAEDMAATAGSSRRKTWRSTGRWSANRSKAGIAATESTRRRRRPVTGCVSSRRFRSWTTTRRSPAPAMPRIPTICITRSRRGVCVTAAARSPIPNAGRSISATICSLAMRWSDTNSSTRKKRTWRRRAAAGAEQVRRPLPLPHCLNLSGLPAPSTTPTTRPSPMVWPGLTFRPAPRRLPRPTWTATWSP